MQKTEKYTGNICIDLIFGTITGFKAVGAKKLRVEFDSAVAEASKASLSIKRGTTEVTGLKQSWDADNKAVELLSDKILAAGDYTASLGNSTPFPAKVNAEKVSKIEIKDQPVLTGTSEASKDGSRSNDEAYIYYEVKNQYDEPMKERVTINWSITSCDASRDNKNLGLVVAHRKNDKEIFTYGTDLDITAVCIKDGETFTDHKTLKIGGIQAIDKVEYKGFVKKRQHNMTLDRKNIKNDVPADFAKNTWALLYQTYDQNGNMIEPAKDNISSAKEGAKLTFISDQPTLIMNEFEDGEVFKVDEGGETIDYSSVNIQPGMYIDRGSEITLKAISTKTGNKNDQNFKIEHESRLKSFRIDTPAGIVADGDNDVTIPFTAVDTDGKTVTNYKTIARSSNTLSFSASEGILQLTEDDEGNAVLKWSDAPKYRKALDANGKETDNTFNPYDETNNNGIIINDNVDRTVSLTAVVTGEESSSNTTTLAVSDMRRPNSIADVRFGVDNNDTVIAGFKNQEVNIIDDIDYIDQYGEKVASERVKNFWSAAKDGHIRGYNYSIRVNQLSGTGNYSILGNYFKNTQQSNNNNDSVQDSSGNHMGGASNSSGSSTVNPDVINLDKQGVTINHNARYADFKEKVVNITNSNGTVTKVTEYVPGSRISDVTEATVRYSIVESEKTNNSRYNDIGKSRTETYTIVPLSKVSDFTIRTVRDKLGIETTYSQYPNGSYIKELGTSDKAQATMELPAEGYKYNSDGKLVDKNDNSTVVTDKDNAATTSAIRIETSKDTKKEVSGFLGYKNINAVKVEAKYQGKTLSVPFMYSRATPSEYKKYDGSTLVNVSGSALSIEKEFNYDKSGNDKYIANISNVNENCIRWRDLYDVNTARYTRIPANLQLEIAISDDGIIYTDSNGYDYCLRYDSTDNKWKLGRDDGKRWVYYKDNSSDVVEVKPVYKDSKVDYYTWTIDKQEYKYYPYNNNYISKNITISDENALPKRMEFSGSTITRRPDNSVITNNSNNFTDDITVFDQYDQINNGGRSINFTVGEYNENNLDGRQEGTYVINNNNNKPVITGVERGDSYLLTATLDNSGITATTTIKAGSDVAAKIESGVHILQSPEYKLRTEHLGYNR